MTAMFAVLLMGKRIVMTEIARTGDVAAIHSVVA
jgi:hypothetical protein